MEVKTHWIDAEYENYLGETKVETNNTFEYDLKFGNQFEQEIFKVLNNKKIECKDESRKWQETGNLFIEFESRGNPSGIEHTEAEWWAEKIHDGCIILFETKKLKETIIQLKNKNALSVVPGGDANTSKGYLINLLRMFNGMRGI